MNPAVLILIYCVLIVVVSLIGGWLPTIVNLTHLRMQITMSFVSGLMLGVAVLHMLPQSTSYLHSISLVGAWMLAGVLVMFFLLRVFHVHHHGDVNDDHDHDHDCGHDHSHDHATPQHRISWIGLFFGLAVHTLLDGVALSASVVAEASHTQASFAVLGLGTFLAVLLHKPLDALSITSLMSTGGWSARSQMFINCAFALACPLGALLFWFGTSNIIDQQDVALRDAIVGGALAFSAGFFLCIALSDLLPEVQFHTHDRFKLTAALLLGVALAIGIESLHSHDHGTDDEKAPHSHQGEHVH